jgi:hypothetical protein
LLWRESFITTEKKSSSCLSGRLCCRVSFWFWWEIGFGCTYYYVLGVPYSCFLLWRGKFHYDQKKSSSPLSGGLCCCVSFWLWREIGFGCTYYYVLEVPYSCGFVLVFWFWREIVFGVTYVLSVQYRSLLRPEKKVLVKKKSSSNLSGRCAIFITTGKKVLVVCLAGARSLLRPEKKVLAVIFTQN